MKSETQLADEFIEDLVSGDIESYLRDIALKGFNWESEGQNLKEFQERIDEYLAEKDSEKKVGLAHEVVLWAVFFRLDAMLRNNPNTTKAIAEQRDFYKSRLTIAEEQLKDYQEKLKSAYTMIDKLTAQLEDEKKGRGGMHTP